MLQNHVLDFLMRSFRMQHKEVTRETALKAAGELAKFFAIELTYQGRPIRIVIAASEVPENLAVLSGEQKSLPTVAGR